MNCIGFLPYVMFYIPRDLWRFISISCLFLEQISRESSLAQEPTFPLSCLGPNGSSIFIDTVLKTYKIDANSDEKILLKPHSTRFIIL